MHSGKFVLRRDVLIAAVTSVALLIAVRGVPVPEGGRSDTMSFSVAAGSDGLVQVLDGVYIGLSEGLRGGYLALRAVLVRPAAPGAKHS